jgi:hypothetical protein
MEQMKRLAAESPQMEQHADGSRSMRLNPKRYSHSVAKVNADGTLSTYCTPGEDAATHARHASAPRHMLTQGGAHEIR